MNKLLKILSLIIGIIPGTLFAEEAQKIVLTESQFKESFLDKVVVSGGVRAGFMYQSSLKKIDINQLQVHLRQETKDENALLCVTMVSRDGRYSAIWDYPLGKKTTGSISVNLPSKYSKQISDYSSDSLVVLAAITTGDCSNNNISYIPTSWGTSAGSEFLLFVNSGGLDTDIGIPGESKKISCSKIEADNTVAYDTLCKIEKEHLVDPKSIYLIRKNFSNRLPLIEFPVR
jgi:hypothetical protein